MQIFQVKWHGYGPAYNTWEPKGNLAHLKEDIKACDAEARKKMRQRRMMLKRKELNEEKRWMDKEEGEDMEQDGEQWEGEGDDNDEKREEDDEEGNDDENDEEAEEEETHYTAESILRRRWDGGGPTPANKEKQQPTRWLNQYEIFKYNGLQISKSGTEKNMKKKPMVMEKVKNSMPMGKKKPMPTEKKKPTQRLQQQDEEEEDVNDEEDDDDEEPEVEKLVGKRVDKDGQIEYLVKWKTFDESW
jgi:hypothetical protein